MFVPLLLQVKTEKPKADKPKASDKSPAAPTIVSASKPTATPAAGKEAPARPVTQAAEPAGTA